MSESGEKTAPKPTRKPVADALVLAIPDIALRSRDAFVSVLFMRSRAAGFFEALEFCERAATFEHGLIRGRPYYHAAFGKTPEQVALSCDAMRGLRGLAGLRIFCGGAEFRGRTYMFAHVLDCFMDSTKCADYRAHCHQIIMINRANGSGLSDRFVFPCSLAYRQGGIGRLDPRHPASIPDQIQAIAVQAGCEWCPRLQIDAFRAVDSNVIDV